MTTITLSRVARAASLCFAALALSATAQAAGDKSAYDQSKMSAKASYDTAKKSCDAMSGNAKDICVAEAKSSRVHAEADAEAGYKNTAKARENAVHDKAEADYDVAKERCDDKSGNAKDVCVKVAKANKVKAEADAKATLKGGEARMDARKDKREADYKVAAEKCDSMDGAAKSVCITAAKSKYKM